MNKQRLFAAIVASLALFTAVACDDDGSTCDVSKPAGGDAGAMCASPYQKTDRPGLDTCPGTGACANGSDRDSICAENIPAYAGQCAQTTCLSSPDAATRKTCIVDCIAAKATLDPSTECRGCYADSVNCTFTYCLSDCAADPSSAACVKCRDDNHCTSGFYTCSGLPVPQ